MAALETNENVLQNVFVRQASQQTPRPTPLSRPEGVPTTANRWILHPSAPVDVRVAFVMGGLGAAAYLWLKEEDMKHVDGTMETGDAGKKARSRLDASQVHIEPVQWEKQTHQEEQGKVQMPEFDARGNENETERPRNDAHEEKGTADGGGNGGKDAPPPDNKLGPVVDSDNAEERTEIASKSENNTQNTNKDQVSEPPGSENRVSEAPLDSVSPYASFEAEEDKEEEKEKEGAHSESLPETEESQQDADNKPARPDPDGIDQGDGRTVLPPRVSVTQHSDGSRTDSAQSTDTEDPPPNDGEESEASPKDPESRGEQGVREEERDVGGSEEQESHPSRSTDELLEAALVHLSAADRDRVVAAFRALKNDQRQSIQRAETQAKNAVAAHQRLRADAVAALQRQKARAEATALEERRQRMASIDDLRLRAGALATLLQQRTEDAHLAANASRISAVAVSTKNVLEGEEDPAKIPAMLAAVERDPLTGIVTEDLKKPPISLANLHAMWKDVKQKALMLDLMPQTPSESTKPNQQHRQEEAGDPGTGAGLSGGENRQGGLLANGLARLGAALKVMPREGTSSEERIEASLARAEGAIGRGSCGEAARYAAMVAKQGGPKVADVIAPFAEAAQQRARWEQAASLLSAHSAVTSAAYAKIR